MKGGRGLIAPSPRGKNMNKLQITQLVMGIMLTLLAMSAIMEDSDL